MKLYQLPIFLMLCTAGVTGCKKYAIAPLMTDPAYIRVFNDLTTTTDVLHSQQAAPFLTFLMDPKTDDVGVPGDGSIIGDFLGTRQLFSLSYPINEANSSIGTGTIGALGRPNGQSPNPVNFEYPGNAHVAAAPVINGFDLSAWAQIPSGKHRIMFVLRPQNSIDFKDLSHTIRGNVLLDTTVNFEKGEVYTLEVVSRDLDNNQYGLYVRREQFIHQAFDTSKLYAGFINLSGKTPAATPYGSQFFFWDKVKINCTYNIYNYAASNNSGGQYYTAFPGYDKTYYTTLNTKMDTAISYLPLPLLPESSFFYQGLIDTYSPEPLQNPATGNQGTLPYFSFFLVDANSPVYDPNGYPLKQGFLLNSSANPVTVNNYDVTDLGVNVKSYTPNLNLVVNTGHTYHIYPSINILELVYDRVYMMQIQRGFDEVPKN